MRVTHASMWIMLMAVVLSSATLAFGAYRNTPRTEELGAGDSTVVGNQVFVQLRDGYAKADLEIAVSKFGGVVERSVPLVRDCYIVSWDSPASVRELFLAVEGLPIVEHVAYNHLMWLSQLYPTNDPYWTQEWNMHDTNIPSYDINAPEAWDVTRGTSRVTMLLLDSETPMYDEFTYTNEDFDLARMQYLGRYCTAICNTPICYGIGGGGTYQPYGHGTMMASIMAARWNDGLYHAGLAPNCNLLVGEVVQCCTNILGVLINPVDAIDALGDAMTWNANPGNPLHGTLRVVALPFDYGTGGNWDPIDDVIGSLETANIFVAAAAGNHNPRFAANIQPPAKYAVNHGNMLACGAYQRNGLDSGNPNGWSCFYFPNGVLDPTRLIAAPGGMTDPGTIFNRTANDFPADLPRDATFGMIDGTTCGWATRTILNMPAVNDPQPGRGDFTGTCASAAHVAGTAALMCSAYPTITAAGLRSTLIATVTPVPGNDVLGAGRMNAQAAVVQALRDFFSIAGTKTLSGNVNVPDFVGTITLQGELVVPSGTTLTIEAGLEIRAGSGAKITVQTGGMLVVNGTQANRVVLHPDVAGQTWQGVFINGGQINMNYADFSGTNPYAVYTEAPGGSSQPVYINFCTFNGGATTAGGIVLRIWNNPLVTQVLCHSKVYNVPTGAGMYLFNCNVNFFMDTIADASLNNSYIKQVTGSLRGCRFTGRVTNNNYGVMFYSSGCTPTVQCCTFENVASQSLWPSTVYCAPGTAPVFSYVNSLSLYGFSNVFHDNSQYLMIFESQTPRPVVGNVGDPGNGGPNDWYQDSPTGKFMWWKNPTSNPPFDCHGQYWSPAVNINMFNPPVPADWNFTGAVANPFGLCLGGGSGNGGGGWGQGGSSIEPPADTTTQEHSSASLDNSPVASAFDQAMTLEEDGDYAQALGMFRNIATHTPDMVMRWNAAAQAINCASRMPTDEAWIPAMLDNLIRAENSPEVYVTGRRMLTSYLIYKGRLTEAAANCKALWQHGLNSSDSLAVAVDMLSVQMAAGSKTAVADIPTALKITDDAQGLALEQELLAKMASAGVSTEKPAAVPQEYTLYQNYPNPFNPTTDIRFDLPEAVRVELKVYNSLGQLVTTLASDAKPAGSYTLTWDGTDASGNKAASGVYIYQLKAGTFNDAKKMLLMK